MKNNHKDITIDDVQQIVHTTSAWKVVNSLLEKGLVSVYENMYENYQPKKEKYVFLTQQYQDDVQLKLLFSQLEKAPKQLNLLLTYLHLKQTQIDVLQAELIKQAEASSAQLNALLDKQVFTIKKIEVDRIKFDAPVELKPNILSSLQETAYREILDGFAQKKAVLLKGITGSGKTHIYFKLIEDCIAQGKQALYLLPEIALTAQIVRKLRSVFGNRIGVYHSRFSNNERVEVWKKIQHKQYDIVIGARSALMLPFADLGLVIIDEEHDTSYKQQDPAPRYHARDCAIFLAHQCKADILLGSATPSVESFFNAQASKYKLVELHERYGNASLPKVTIVDSKLDLLNKTQKGIFSGQLVDAIQDSIANKKQVILFQNRRGYSPYVMCSTCGWVPHCKYCDVSLTYHKHTDQLHCHYCGSKSPYIKSCPACGNSRLVAKSFGTEKIEDDIKQLFPYARVERFDWDALKTKNKYSEIIRKFENREIDILVGTQMLVKGLDFEHVNTVGVLSADSLLSFPDFRVNERVFQLLEQVSGRAGRKDDMGRVMIQLFKTNHPTILQVKAHDYKGFYLEEIQSREEFQYPPFTRLLRITLRHKNQDTVLFAAQKLAEHLVSLPKTILFGPAEPPIGRIRNQFIQEILLKMNKDTTVMQEIKKFVREKIVELSTTKNFTTVQVVVDVDPF